MKNSILFGILTLLLCMTYVIQEYLPQKALLEKQGQTAAINISNFKEIHLPHFSVLRTRDGLSINKYEFPINIKKLSKFVGSLENIKLERVMDSDVNDPKILRGYLGRNPITFKIVLDAEEIKYTLGEKPSVSGNFYILKENYYKKELLLCRDENVIDQIYRTDQELQLKKFYAFYQKINSEPVDFANKRIFTATMFKKFIDVEINNKRNRFFSLDFKKKETKPKPIGGLEYNTRFFHEYLKQLQGMEFSAIYKKDKLLKEQVASIKLNKDDKVLLFKQFGEKKGYFVSHFGSNSVYEIKDFQAKVFYQNVQSFWLKSFSFFKDIESLDGLAFDITFFDSKKNKKFSINVQDNELFKITIKDRPHWKVEEEKFVSLLKILFGLEKYSQAASVSEYNEEYEAQNEKRREFRIEMFGKKLDFYVKNLEISVANLTERYILHYSNLEKKTWGNTPKAFFDNAGVL